MSIVSETLVHYRHTHQIMRRRRRFTHGLAFVLTLFVVERHTLPLGASFWEIPRDA